MPQSLPYSLDKAAILTDLTSERPQWILSAYGPGRHAPAQLFGGRMREQSFEEMRLLHYMSEVLGNPQQAVQEADKLFRASEDQIQAAVNNIDNAINFISESKENPNRIDICKRSAGVDGGFKANPFDQGTPTSSLNPIRNNQFGAPSQSGSTTQFGAPSHLGPAAQFGTSSQPGPTSQFGAPSMIGQKPNPFAPVKAGSSANPFGAYSNNSNVFSPQSQKHPTNPFGAPSQSQTSSALPRIVPGGFGAPSGQNSSPFANSKSPSLTPFGAPSPAPANPFQTKGATPFGAPSAPANPFQTPGATATPFDAPSAPGNSFRTSGATSNPFGALSPAPVNSFQAMNTQTPVANNPFAPKAKANAPIQTATQSAYNPFQNQETQLGSNPLPTSANETGSASQSAVRSNSRSGTSVWPDQPSLASYSSLRPDGKALIMFKGRRVVYRADDPGFENGGRWQRIWCPKGVPSRAANTELDATLYDGSVEAEYLHLHQNGAFQGGVIPMIPPKLEWCRFDF
jgi:nucleoporin NUP42